MTAEDLVRECRQRGIRLEATGEKLIAEGPLTPAFTEELRARKAELLALLAEQQAGRPYIGCYGDLVIPFASAPKYHWWADGQSIADTLVELNVSREVWGRYVDRPFPERKGTTT